MNASPRYTHVRFMPFDLLIKHSHQTRNTSWTTANALWSVLIAVLLKSLDGVRLARDAEHHSKPRDIQLGRELPHSRSTRRMPMPKPRCIGGGVTPCAAGASA